MPPVTNYAFYSNGSAIGDREAYKDESLQKAILMAAVPPYRDHIATLYPPRIRSHTNCPLHIGESCLFRSPIRTYQLLITPSPSSSSPPASRSPPQNSSPGPRGTP